MATSYPTGLDAFTNPTVTDTLATANHVGQHSNVNDAVEAIEAELGLSPSGAAATVKARFDALDTLVSGKVGSTTITTIWKGTAAEYAALGAWDANTLYVVT